MIVNCSHTPIFHLDEEFWQSTLIKPRLLGIISENTEIIHAGYKRRSHSAKGEGPFGKLTQLGLLQMVKGRYFNS
jgi:hypothetical protein